MSILKSMSNIFIAVRYLKILHPLKKRYDYVMPAIVAFVFLSLYLVAPLRPNILGENGILIRLNNLFQILPGFYIAALAAVSTFNERSLDEKLKGHPATLKIDGDGFEVLTRRRFLCLMFGYLATLCMLIFFVNIVADILYQNLVLTIGHSVVIDCVLLYIYLFFLSQLFVVSLWGLYYMVEGIHVKIMK